ncbi:uncharacterized protein LOC119732261 [Patiria miniata]|uniref:Uncharacterized protein n=1 Tax=Patiria miniata TaxID=46514 RepID=A0A914ADS8_PATMI|nr:uncharacterized protein LOC119732261 [Patiria miniata]
MHAITLLFCGLVAAVGFYVVDAQHCCYTKPYMIESVSGVIYSDNSVHTEVGIYGRDPNSHTVASDRTATDVNTGAQTRTRIIQKFNHAASTGKVWTIKNETNCSMEEKPLKFRACVSDDFLKIPSFTYGKDGLTVDRYQKITPSLSYTLYYTPDCVLTNAMKVETKADGKTVYLRNYGNFREVDFPCAFDDLFNLPDFCPGDVLKESRRFGEFEQILSASDTDLLL